MRKRMAGRNHAESRGETNRDWLDLESIATVEVTSEDPDFPIEGALGLQGGPGWRASEEGEQRIRLIFDEPVALRRIHLRFDEVLAERTQEFTLRWSPASGGSHREIVRQQWNFSPSGSTMEIEEYVVDLAAVSVLELSINPDLSRRETVATLTAWRIG